MEFKETPLITAVRIEPNPDDDTFEQRREAMVRFLLKHGASTSPFENESWPTPLVWVQKHGLDNIAELLSAAE